MLSNPCDFPYDTKEDILNDVPVALFHAMTMNGHWTIEATDRIQKQQQQKKKRRRCDSLNISTALHEGSMRDILSSFLAHLAY